MKKRTLYRLTNQVMTAGKIGTLVPFDIREVCPGDTWSGKNGTLVRFSPLKKAALQDFHVDLFYFYVPHRLVWADWEDFIAAGPMNSPTYVSPSVTLTPGETEYESLFMLANTAETRTYSALRVHAYNLIYNEFFRDEQGSVVPPSVAPGQFGRAVNYKKDFWTTIREDLGVEQETHYFPTNVGSGNEASAHDVLEAIARQKIAMKRATYGTRYIDILRSYGINVNYQMLQRPEVVGVGRQTAQVTDVVSTAADGAGLGELAGHGISGTRLTIRRKTFPEHGTLMGLLVCRPKFVHPGVTDWFHYPARGYHNYYDPGLVPLPPVQVTKGHVYRAVDAAEQGTQVGFVPWGEWYRRTNNWCHPQIDDSWRGIPDLPETGTWNANSIRQMDPARFDALFNDVTTGHFQVSAVNALKALRLLPRAQISTTTGMGG